MNSRDYEKQKEFTIANITLSQKSKSCGKPNCGQCPHGGFWYAFVPAELSTNGGGRVEIYLGKFWTHASLLENISPKLKPQPRKAFKAVIERAIDEDALKCLERDWQSVGKELSRLEVDYVRDIERLQKNKRRIESDMTKVRARLGAK